MSLYTDDFIKEIEENLMKYSDCLSVLTDNLKHWSRKGNLEEIEKNRYSLRHISKALLETEEKLSDNIHNKKLDDLMKHKFNPNTLADIDIETLSLYDKELLIKYLDSGNPGDVGYSSIGYLPLDFKSACLLYLLKVIRLKEVSAKDNYKVDINLLDNLECIYSIRYKHFYKMLSFVKEKFDEESILLDFNGISTCLELLEKEVNYNKSINFNKDMIKLPGLKIEVDNNNLVTFSYTKYEETYLY